METVVRSGDQAGDGENVNIKTGRAVKINMALLTSMRAARPAMKARR